MCFSTELSTSCLPQGSILEPVLVSAFINDLVRIRVLHPSKFASNVKLSEAADSIEVKISLAWD